VLKQPGHKSDHLPLSIAEAKNVWSHISAPPYVVMMRCLSTGTTVPLVIIILFYLCSVYLTILSGPLNTMNNSAVSIVMGYGSDGWDSIPGRGYIFLFSTLPGGTEENYE
jgi:hypothetical protein